MDTRFWGPSGWQLYHLVAHSYKGTHREKYEEFYDAMKDVLPCRFCRESTAKFMKESPPKIEHIVEWVYDLHNKVNHKLRSQCHSDPKVICPPPDPSLEKTNDVYRALLASEPEVPAGLDFLFCVAYNYKTNLVDNSYYNTFVTLADIYPYEDLRHIIKQYIGNHSLKEALTNPTHFYKWWYNLAKKLCKHTGFPLGTLRGTLQKYGRYKSGCTRGKTCRNGKKIRDHRKTYKITHDRLVHVS
jgi:hypothetical protein